MAQVISFTNPNDPAAPHNFKVTIPGGTATVNGVTFPISFKSTSVSYTVTVYRRHTFTDNGYIRICSGTPGSPTAHLLTDDNAGALPSATNNTATTATSWVLSNDGFTDIHTLSGTFSTTNISPTDQGLYAIFVYSAGTGVIGDISDGIVISGQTALPPPPPVVTPPASVICTGGRAICDDQCVPYNSVPSLLHGQQLVNTTVTGISNNPFAAPGTPSYITENEAVTWEYSVDNYRWTQIPNATNKDYQPGPCTVLTFYRRVSTHMEYHHIFGGDFFGHREYWYTSNVVTITPGVGTPQPVQSTYTACSTGIFVSVNTLPGATSYTWTTSNPGIKINGSGTYYPTVTSDRFIQLTLPAGAATGTSYQVTVSAIGPCGARSPTASFSVQVDCSLQTATNVSFVSSSSGTTCRPTYNVIAGRRDGAISYTATLHGNSLYEGATLTVQADPSAYYATFPFNIPGPLYGMSASVTVTNSSGTSAPIISAPQDLAGGNCAGGMAALRGPSGGVYPNPATDQVALAGVAREAQAAFYDGQGVCRKLVPMHEKDAQTTADLHDLPAGLYHVRISANGKLVQSTQLVVQH